MCVCVCGGGGGIFKNRLLFSKLFSGHFCVGGKAVMEEDKDANREHPTQSPHKRKH